MKKEISLTFKILAVCIASILITGILYIVLFPISMNFNQKQVGEFVGRTGIIIAGMTPLFTYLVYVLYKPVRLVLNKIKNDETIEINCIKKRSPQFTDSESTVFSRRCSIPACVRSESDH